GLYNQTGRGRKPTFNEEQKQKIKSWVKLYPKDLKKVLAQIKEEWGITVSKDTIKRVLRSLIMTWRRFQRGLAGARSLGIQGKRVRAYQTKRTRKTWRN
ncbi:MAG: IS630 family transposase, partial [Dolichospermum sp.]